MKLTLTPRGPGKAPVRDEGRSESLLLPNPQDRRTRLALQRHRNRESLRSWDTYAAHRARVTSLLIAAAPQTRGRLCLLGAGNCNDLDLQRLHERFDELHLVDLDAEAMSTALERQGLTRGHGVWLHGDVDLLCESPVKLLWPGPTDPLSAEAARDGRFQVVASVCLLSQLIEAVCGQECDPAGQAERALAMRDRHIEQMLQLLEPGGVGVLVTDFVSSDTCAELAQISDADLAAASRRWIAAGNFFTGLNPWAIRQRMQQGRWATLDPAHVLLIRPWRWEVGPRNYAVSAICFARRSPDVAPGHV